MYERFNLHKKLKSLESFLNFPIITSRLPRRRDGDSFYVRRRRFMGIFLSIRSIEATRAALFRQRSTILYPLFNFYPGASTDPWWEEHEALFFFRFRFRRVHFLSLMDEMEVTIKIFNICCCAASSGQGCHVHNYPADLCILVVLRRLAYPCTFKELVDVFGIPSNRLCDMYHTAIDYIYS